MKRVQNGNAINEARIEILDFYKPLTFNPLSIQIL